MDRLIECYEEAVSYARKQNFCIECDIEVTNGERYAIFQNEKGEKLKIKIEKPYC